MVACETKKARLKKVKGICEKNVKIKGCNGVQFDSDSDDGQTDSDNGFLLDDWDEWMAN